MHTFKEFIQVVKLQNVIHHHKTIRRSFRYMQPYQITYTKVNISTAFKKFEGKLKTCRIASSEMLDFIRAELEKREDCTIPKYELNALRAVLEFNLGLGRRQDKCWFCQL